MVFQILGQVVRRGWFVLLAAWGLLLLGTWLAAPRWEDVVQDQQFGNEAEPPAAEKPARKRSIIARIRTPSSPGGASLLVSPDRQALLVLVELTTEFGAHANWPIIDKIEGLIANLRRQGKMPPG